MINKLFLFLSFVCFSIYGQTTSVQGKVVNKETQEGIPFGHLIITKLKKGTSTDEEGYFILTFETNEAEELVKISSVGYVDRRLKVKELTGQITLEPKIDDLGEVRIYDIKDKKHKRVNPFIGARIVGLGNFSGGAYPSALARHYERPEKFDQGCFIKEVEIDFYRVIGKPSPAARFRLRVLRVSEDGKPGSDLLVEDLILKKEANARSIKIDLLPYKIAISQKGLFIVVEHIFIPENRFLERLSIKDAETGNFKTYEVARYAPIFKGVEVDQKSDSRSYYKSLEGWKAVAQLNTANSILAGSAPAPAFKVLFTD